MRNIPAFTAATAPAHLLDAARQMARMIAAPAPFDMGATVEIASARLMLAALRERKLDDHGEVYRLLSMALAEHDPARCAEIYDLIAEDVLRLAAIERQAAEDEADDHDADETLALHSGFRRTA